MKSVISSQVTTFNGLLLAIKKYYERFSAMKKSYETAVIRFELLRIPSMKSNIVSWSNLKVQNIQVTVSKRAEIKSLGSKLSLCVLLFIYFFCSKETPLGTLGFQMISIYTHPCGQKNPVRVEAFRESFLNIFSTRTAC